MTFVSRLRICAPPTDTSRFDNVRNNIRDCTGMVAAHPQDKRLPEHLREALKDIEALLPQPKVNSEIESKSILEDI